MNSALMFLQYGAGLRMISFWDPRHRISRELENSITHGGSGLRGAMLAAEFILSFQRGPWSGHKWHRILQEEASEWLAQAAGQSDALVQHLLPGIGKELGLSQTDISRTDILAGLANAKFLQHRGPASASRWDAFHAGWSERRSELSLMLGLLISFGLKCGYLSGVLNKAGWSETRAAECDDKSTLKAETKAQMYRQCRNKLHVVTMTLLNTDVVSMIQAWYCISVPVSDFAKSTYLLWNLGTWVGWCVGMLEHVGDITRVQVRTCGWLGTCVCVCVCACVIMCVRTKVGACTRACVGVCFACVCVCVRRRVWVFASCVCV